jgi:hypothetical protein
MVFKERIGKVADLVEDIFLDATNERDKASGAAKTFMRRVTKHLDTALSNLEHAEDFAEKNNL